MISRAVIRASAALALAAPLLVGPVMTGAAAARGDEDYKSESFLECRRQGVNVNQCYCFAQWIRGNGYYVNKTVVVELMQAYPLTGHATIGEEVYGKIRRQPAEIEPAVKLLVEATNYCSKWENK